MNDLIMILDGVDKTRLALACICMILDIFTGTLGALIKKRFSSTVFREGLFKKVLEVVTIVIGYILDYTLTVSYIGIACIYLVIGLEIYSILIENVSEYIPLPAWLINIVDSLKEGQHTVSDRNEGSDE